MSSAPIRARVLHTRYAHMGAHAGMGQLPRAFDPAEVTARIVGVANDDEDCRLSYEGVRRALRSLGTRRGMIWYNLSDLMAERDAAAALLRGEVDVLHWLDGEHAAQFLSRALRRLPFRRVRMVGTYHQPAAMLDRAVDPKAVATLDLATVVSPSQVEWFASRVPGVRVEVVLHGIDAEFFAPGPGRAGAPDGVLRCVTVGEWLRDWPAMHAIVERASRLGRIEFHVVAGRDTGIEGLPGVVRHRGLSDEALRALYRESDVLLLPLLDATANNALLEAMACGVPVVTTDTAALRAYVPDDAGVLVPVNDPDTIVQALEWLGRDEVARRSMGMRGRARAEALAWPRAASQVARLYRELLA